MNKHTKLVTTIGPATETEEIFKQLLEAGMNVARFNTKHSDPEWHNERIIRAKKVAAKLGQPLGILLDLQGPEVRIELPEQAEFDVKIGETAVFTSDRKQTEMGTVYVPQDVIESLDVDNIILLADGACEFQIISKKGHTLVGKSLMDSTVKHRKTMNTPGVVLNMPSLTDRDYLYLDGVDLTLVDFV